MIAYLLGQIFDMSHTPLDQIGALSRPVIAGGLFLIAVGLDAAWSGKTRGSV